MYQCIQMNNTIVVTFKYAIDKINYLQDEYSNLKEFFNQIVKKQAEPVVIKMN